MLAISCGSTEVKDKSSLDEAKEGALSGEEKDWEAIEKAMQEPPPADEPDLHEMIVKEARDIPTEEARELLRKSARSEDETVRELALDSLYEHRKHAGPDAVEKEIVEIIDNNRDEFGSLNDTEINMLSKIDQPGALDLLSESLGENPETDPLALRGIGMQVDRKKLQSAQLENQLEAQKESEEPDAEKTKELEQELQKTQEESALGKEMLENYFKAAEKPSQKELALAELYNAASPDSDEKMMGIFHSDEFDPDEKEMAVAMLVKRSPEFAKNRAHTRKKELIEKQSAAFEKRLQAANDEELDSIALVEKNDEYQKAASEIEAFGGQSKKSIALEIKALFQKRVETEKVNRLKKLPPMSALEKILKPEGVYKKVLLKMHRNFIGAIKDKSTPRKPQSTLAWAAITLLQPGLGYHEIRKFGSKGLKRRGVFGAVMKTIENDYDTDELRVIALQTLWGVNSSTARRILKGYRSQKKILKAVGL